MKNHLVLSLIGFAVGLGCAIPMNAAAEDHGWPREIKSPKARILLYEPQLESLEKTTLKERSAISVTPAGKTEPVFGVIWADAQVAIDRDDRTVHFLSIDVTRVRFPGSTPEKEKELETILEAEFPKWDLTYSLDRMIAGLEQARKEQAEAEGFRNDPPRVIFATQPTVLVVLDGEPKELPIQGTDLKRVVNTPYFLVSDPDDGGYFLGTDDFWFKADEIRGPWKEIKSPPKRVATALEKEQKQAASKRAEGGAVPQQAATPQPAATAEKGPAPAVIVSTEPAELIVSNGAPKWSPIAGTDLLYMSNTDGDVIKELDTQKNYVLLSGRWYRGETFAGPWEFVRPDALPESFASIPEKSEAGDVLAHVAGTPQAEEALVDAQLPQTSAIERSKATTEVTYDGEPQFKPIPKTKIAYAINTSSEVLRIKGRYYVCDQGVWFLSDTPNGPWVVADSVPDDVQQIPPESPVYNTKYVYVYDSTPDWVYVGYLPGYLGCYPYYNTVVYGTGWYYPGWYGSVYYPRPLTWGFGAHYNSYYGWSFGVSFGFGYGSFGIGYGGYGYPYYGYAGYGYPYYGYPYYGYPYSYGWWGPGGYCYRPTHTTVTVNNNYGPRQPRGDWQHPSHVPRGQNNLYKRPGNAPRNASVPHDRAARPVPPHAANLPNNVYAGRDGNVYRRTNSGWQTRDQSGWKPAPQAQAGNNGLPRHPTPGSATPPAGRPTGGRPAPGSAPPAPSAPVSHGPGTHPAPPQTTAPPPHAAPGPPPASGRPAAPPPRQSAPPSSLQRSYQARERGSARVQGYRGGGGDGGARPPAGGGGKPRGGGHH